MEEEIMLKRYDEEKGEVTSSLDEAIENEIKIYRSMMKIALKSKCIMPTKVEQFRTWVISDKNKVKIRFIMEMGEDKNETA